MNVTNNLKLPQYTEEDIFDLQDINKSYDSIDKAYKEVIDFKNEIPKTNATAEVIDARGGKETLGERLNEFDEQLEHIPKYQYVDYFRFGAKGDGTTDDTEAIYNTHVWANQYNVPIRNQSGIFKLDSHKIIPVQTNCYLYGTKFIINEAKDIYFEIKSKKEKINLNIENYKNVFRTKVNAIPSLKDYENSFLYFEDSTIRTGKRYGTTQDFALQDFIVVGKGGKIVGDIQHDILNPTLIECYPFDDNNLEFNGANFDLICEGTPFKDFGIGGLLITRSNVTVNDVIMLPNHSNLHSSGSIYIGKCANVIINNSTFIPRIPKTVNTGTYGIGADRVINLQFINCNGESTSIAGGTENYWGVMGTNLIKDLLIERCNFNRVDCHFQAYNIKINNSTIGNRGITVCGGGILEITNINISALDILTLRNDYGARWNGDIIINNINWTPFSDDVISIIKAVPNGDGSHDYGYELLLAKNINIDNIKMYQLYTSINSIPILRLFDNDTFNGDYYLPNNIKIKNLSFINRYNLRGFIFSNNTHLYKFKAKNSHTYNGVNDIKTNANLTIDNVTLHDFKQSNPLSSDGLQTVGHFIIDKTVNDNIYSDPYQFCPKIIFRNLDGLILKHRGLRSYVEIDNCKCLFIDGYGYSLHSTSNICNFTKIIDSEICPAISEGAYATVSNRFSLFIAGEIDNTKLYPIYTTAYKNDLNCYKYLIDTSNRRIGKLDVFNIICNNVILKNFDLTALGLNDTDIESVLINNNNPRYSRIYGTTANRQHNDKVPFWYWDTTISKPICWNGASWFVPN